MSVSGRDVDEVKEQMSAELEKYTLTLLERGDIKEEIKAPEVGLRYLTEEIDSLKERQKPFLWITAFFNKEDFQITVGVSYDENLLKDRIDRLSCFDSNRIIEPKNPVLQYTENKYVMIEEVCGNRVNKEVLYDLVADALLKKETVMDLESNNCYVNPQYTSKSPETIEALNTLNRYVSSQIIYILKDKKEIIDGSIINKWLKVDDSFVVTFDEKSAEAYIKELLERLTAMYNTVGKKRSFITSSGKTISIGGGDYGWRVEISKDIPKDTVELLEGIKQGRTIVKEPKFKQTARALGSNDIGNTYVEIDLTNQHLWFYKNGSLIVECPVVTGNVRTNHATPAGVYRLKYKERNATLDGPDYSVRVSYWMPFNGGIGMHDATWRSSFGGKIYRTNGSHGCINMPYNAAKTVYNNITPGTPVICYH